MPACGNLFTTCSMLVADSLYQSHWGKTLFRNLGFCLLEGSLTVILGKNGMAKKRLLDTLAGTLKPKRGQVRFEGQPVFGHQEFQGLVARIGTQNDLEPEASVEENIQRFVQVSGMHALVAAAMHYFKLAPYAGEPVAMLPPHLQRRVMLARLLAVPCPLWLIEHSEQALDSEGNELLYMLVSNRCNQDGIVVMTAVKADFISPNLPLDLDDFA